MLRGTPAPAWRRNISTTALLGAPNTGMPFVVSTVSAYAAAARSATTSMCEAIESASGWTWTTTTS
jgi:hypothetical protein